MASSSQMLMRKFFHFWSEQALRARSIDADGAPTQSPGTTVEIVLLGVFLGLAILINNDGVE